MKKELRNEIEMSADDDCCELKEIYGLLICIYRNIIIVMHWPIVL